MNYSIYELLSLFCIYAFLGWCTEVIYAAVNSGKFVNRGFLNGPVCPIYGFGMILVIISLEPLKENLLILFIGSVILTTVIEFITGLVLENIFNNKWWDYSQDPFNIKGYICLKFSLIWGVGCVLVVNVIEPIIYDLISAVPHGLGVTLLGMCMFVFAIDFVVTASIISEAKKRFKVIDEVGSRLKAISNEIGENLCDTVFMAAEAQEYIKENVDNVKDKFGNLKGDVEKHLPEIEELTRKYKNLLEKRNAGYERLVRAFPDLQKGKYKEYIERIKKYMKK